MANRHIGPEAKIIALFTALPEDSKRIVFDVIKGQTAAPRKVATKKPKKGVDTSGTITRADIFTQLPGAKGSNAA